MQYGAKVDFVTDGESVYNPDTGQVETVGGESVTRFCTIYDMTDSQAQESFGRVDVHGVLVSHLGKVEQAQRLIYKGREYTITSRRQVKRKASYRAYGDKI